MLVSFTGNKYDRNINTLFNVSKLLQGSKTVHNRHIHIQKDNIYRILMYKIECLSSTKNCGNGSYIFQI